MLDALRVVPRLLRSAAEQQALREDPSTKAERLRLPSEAGPLLLNILNAAERAGTAAPVEDRRSAPSQEVRDMLMQPFGHITWSFRILTGMSVLMFLVGLAFLVVAVVQAVDEGEVSTSTLTIAGVGLADFFLLFYRRPWEDIARGLSNSQQARIVATSYLSAISMLRSDDPNAHAALQALTREAVHLLEEYTEPSRLARGRGTANSEPSDDR
jgi:hypothetical protein